MSSEKRRIRNDVIMIGSIVALIVLGDYFLTGGIRWCP